jgi:hypothetical protein
MIITDFTLGRLDVVVLWGRPETRCRRPWWEAYRNDLQAGVGRLELVASWLPRDQKARAAD